MALNSRQLTPEDSHFLLRARDLDDLLTYLRTTAYGPVLSGWDWRSPGAEADLSRRLYGDLSLAFEKVNRGLQKRETRFIGVLGQRLVAENLKIVLRALYRDLPPEQSAAHLLPVAGLSPLNFGELLHQETIPRLVESLAATSWGPPLNRGLPRFLRERSLFPLEMSLDLWVFDLFWEGLNHLARPDRAVAAKLLGAMVDITNITWTLRFRELYGFGGEEIYQYLIAGGSFRPPGARRDLAFAANTPEMVARLPRESLAALLQGAGDGSAVAARLSRYWLARLEQVLLMPPFQIGLPIAYLFLKELELDNLISLITGRLLDLPAERLEPLLKGRGAGG
jgi:V/A-type H+-transporting ATPase subunit C